MLAPVATVGPADLLLAVATSRWLKEHVAYLDAPQRYADSVLVWNRFIAEQRALPVDDDARVLLEPLTIANVTRALIDAFVAWRRAQGVSAPTISRDLAAVRGPINYALDQQHISVAPKIKDVKGRKKTKELEWDPEQVAVIIEAARAAPERQHVHLFAMIMLSTHGRVEATLELDIDEQVRRGLIHFNGPDRDQTRKRRPIVPIVPTLAPWLRGLSGKAIVYRVPVAEKRWKVPGVPEYFERETTNIANAFHGVLLAAHELRPDLGFARQKRDSAGKLMWLPPREKLGEKHRRPDLESIGTPNTLRHTIHTWHKRMGTIEAQIDAAAGHSEEGTGASYTHLRPDYLSDFVEKTELFWAAVGKFTRAHLKDGCDTSAIPAAANLSRAA